MDDAPGHHRLGLRKYPNAAWIGLISRRTLLADVLRERREGRLPSERSAESWWASSPNIFPKKGFFRLTKRTIVLLFTETTDRAFMLDNPT
ncbi:MAG: hypothetical protein COA78_31535 [Blastopirellula sp.]|nr:MAG: hypothetical protein COA78_31535 [Blastopirellula sp.]